MPLSAEAQALRDRLFLTLQAAALPLQQGPDLEVSLEALIDAIQMLQDKLRRELTLLREEQAD